MIRKILIGILSIYFLGIVGNEKKASAQTESVHVPPYVLTFYYPWYGTPEGPTGYWSHWNPALPNMGSTHTPLIGFYDSQDPAVAQQHIDFAREASIDGFIVSWWGRNAFDDIAFQTILKVAEENQFLITPYYEIVNPATIEQALSDLRYIWDRYAASPAFLKVNGKPVIFFYGRAVYNLSFLDWITIRKTLLEEGRDFFIMGDLSLPSLMIFDGVHMYSVAGMPRETIKTIYRQASFVTRGAGKLFAATVIPGYDDTNCNDPGFVQDRENGDIYQDLWQIAINARPNWVLITSFNEWCEGTEVEPSEEFLYFYLELTRAAASVFREAVSQ